MSTKRYLCLHRSSPNPAPTGPAAKPSPAEMQEMFAAWSAWKERFKPNLLDLGGKLGSSGKVVSTSGVTDGPFVEVKEVVGGYMVLAAESYEQAVEIVRAGPAGMIPPGAHIEIREIADY